VKHMKNKLGFLIKHSLDKKIKAKTFKIVNIIMAILMILTVNMDKIISSFGGNFKDENFIYVYDEIGTLDSFESYFETLTEGIPSFENTTVKYVTDIETIKEEITEEKNSDILIQIKYDDDEYVKAEMYSFDVIDAISFQTLSNVLNSIKSEFALSNSNIDMEELVKISTPISIARITLDENLDENSEAREMFGYIVSMIFVIPFFIIIMMLVQMIGAEINEEKTSRSMEIIISNVSPRTHFAAKLFSSISFVLLQILLMFGYSLLGLLIRVIMGGGIDLSVSNTFGLGISEIFEMLKSTGLLSEILTALPLLLLLIVFNLAAYAILTGVLASVTTSIEDFQQIQTPIMILVMTSYFVAFMVTSFEGAIFIKAMSYIPFLSSMIAPVLFFAGQMTMIELGISTLISLVGCVILFIFGLRVYKVGILNYSSKDLWKKIFKSMKEN